MLSRVRLPKIRVPNTRTGALGVAGAIAFAGFLLGMAYIGLVPAARAGQGPLAFLFRASTRHILDARVRNVVAPLPTAGSGRPELWLTPTATIAFPNSDRVNELHTTNGVRGILYQPGRTEQTLAPAPLVNAVGRPIVSVVISFGADQDAVTPGPMRPDGKETSSVTVFAIGDGPGQSGACSIAMRQDVLQTVAVSGLATPDDCADGQIRLAGAVVSYALSTDLLPNHRTRDGTWREGGVLGRSEVYVVFKTSAG